MEAELLLWIFLDDVHHRVDLTHSFVCYSGYDFIPTDGTS